MITKFLFFILVACFVSGGLQAANIPPEITKELWFLNNTGATYRLLGYDLRWQDLRGKIGADIGIPKTPIELKKKIRVAVIDSGVHMRHSYLDGFVPWDRLEEYKSTVAIQSPDARFEMRDEEGHGTHIAGVMASVFRALNLKSGQRAEDYFEIIPFKVFNYSNDQDFLQNRVFENFKKAIRQALDLKVDVILTSTSWPKLDGSEQLDPLLKEAVDAGVIFVGAAGNKLSRNIMFPCDSQYVFCVGASNQQGQFASQFSEVIFGGSNYGLAVDALAPGVNILSGYVQSIDVQPKIFLDANSPMYSLDGTSQAAPLAAAVAAVLKSVFPNHSRDAVLSQMYLGADEDIENVWYQGYSTSLVGSMSLEKSLAADPEYLVFPQLKGHLEFEAKGANVEIPLQLKCIRYPCGKYLYKILINQRGQNRKVTYSDTQTFPRKVETELKFPYVLDLNGSAEVDIAIQMEIAGVRRFYKTSVTAQRPKDQLQMISQNFVTFKESRNPVEIRGSSKLQFLTMDDIDEKAKKIVLVDLESQTTKELAIPGLSKVRFAFERDLNGDGKNDLAIIYTITDASEKEDSKKEKEYISYLDLNLQPLSGLTASFSVELPGGLWPFSSSLFKWRWVDYASQKLQVPVIFGILPQTSRAMQPVLHPKSFDDSLSYSSQKKQILSFEPNSEKVFKMRTLTDFDFYQSSYKNLKLNPHDEINFIEILHADGENHQFLAAIKERSNVRTVVFEASADYSRWSISNSVFQSALSTRLRTQFWRPEIAEKDRTFIIQEYNKYQQLILFEQKGKVFEFSVTDSEPVKYFLDAMLTDQGLVLITATDFEFKAWLVTPGSTQARVVSRLHYDYMNVHENSQQMLTHNFVRPIANGGREVVLQNAYWNGNRLSSLQISAQSQLQYSLKSSYVMPHGCLLTKELSQRPRNSSFFGLAFCFNQPNHFMLVQTKP